MNKQFIANITRLRTAIDSNKLVVFTGAGISIDAGVPAWGSLINELSKEINIPSTETDYLKIAQMYYNDRGQKDSIDKVRNVLQYKKRRFNEIHNEIFNLNPEHILTTNYDDLLEQVIISRSLPFSIIKNDQEFPYAKNTKLLVKIHGDLDNTDIVLKEDDYIDYSINHPLIEGFIKSIFATKVVLFVGYSFSDVNLKMILQNVRNILGKNFQNAFILMDEDSFMPIQRDYFKKKGINVINYFDAVSKDEKGAEFNYIEKYLKGENCFEETYYEEGVNLSLKGQHLLNLLKFIANFDSFNESIKDKHIIDQMYESLNRFSELASLPPKFIANLYPFRTSGEYQNTYEQHELSLEIRNRKIEILFFKQIKIERNQAIYIPMEGEILSEREMKSYSEKITKVIEKINKSLIINLIVKDDNYNEKTENIRLRNDLTCNCYNCLFRRFEFNNLLKNLNEANITETSEINSDLEIAYGHYKVGNFIHSYNLFEEIANKAWQQGAYISYYIAKHNIVTLRNLIKYREENLSEEKKENIIKKIDNYDFDRLIYQILYIGKDGYELLNNIYLDNILKEAQKGVTENTKLIRQIYFDYKFKKGISISGPYYPQNIKYWFYALRSFYDGNFIISDEFVEHKEVYGVGIEAFLISFATNKDYKNKVKKLDIIFFEKVLLYGNTSDIKKIMETYEIDKIEFLSEDLITIVNNINNFFKSFFKTSNLFELTSENYSLITQSKLGFFANKCKDIFSNIMLIFSSIELEEAEGKDLIKNFIKFLDYAHFLWGDSIDYINTFLYKNQKIFSQDDWQNLLVILNKKNNQWYKSIKIIGRIFREKNLEGLSNKKILNSLKFSFIERNLNIVVDLWLMSNESLKTEFYNELIEYLDKKFDDSLYEYACRNEMLDYKIYFDTYIQHLNKHPFNFYCEMRNRSLLPMDWTFINKMYFIYLMDIDFDNQTLSKLENISDYGKFYLNPERFNSSKFKTEWLLFSPNKVFLDKFSKIPYVKAAIETTLKKEHDSELAEIYTQYFL